MSGLLASSPWRACGRIVTLVVVAASCLVVAPAPAVADDVMGLGRVHRQIRTEWSLIQSLVENHAYRDAFVQIDAFRDALDRVGVGKAEAEATGFLARLRQMGPEVGRQTMMQLVDRTALLDPGSPRSHAARMHVILDHNLGEWSRLPIEAVNFVRASLADYPTRLRFAAVVAAALSFGLLASSLVMMWIAVLRYLPLLHHRLSHFTLYSLPLPLTIVGLIAATVLSVFEGAGVLLPTLLLVALCAPFFDGGPRRGLLLALAGLAVLPVLAKVVWQDVTFRESALSTIASCEEGLCDASVSELSDPAQKRSPYVAEIAYALALQRLRAGDVEEGVAHLKRARSLGLQDTAVAVAMGNARAMMLADYCPISSLSEASRPIAVQAMTEYEGVLGSEPDNAAALHNAAVLGAALGRDGEAQRWYATARQITDGVVPHTLRRMTAVEPFNACRTDVSITGSLAWDRLDDDTFAAATARAQPAYHPYTWLPMQEIMLGRLRPSVVSILAVSLMLVVFALGVLVGQGGVTRRCQRCSAPFCRGCGETGTAVVLCPECLMEQQQISQKDPKEVWLRQTKLERKVVRRSRWALLVGLAVPGLAHLLARRPARGLFALMALLSTLALLLGPLGYLPAWSAQYGAGDLVSYLAPAVILPFVYLFGMADAFQARREISG